MATKKSKQVTKPNDSIRKAEKNNKLQDFIAYIKVHKIASILIAVTLLGIAIYGSMVLYEKWQFKTAEKQLDSLYADIVNELGDPASYEKNTSCGYSSAKFSKGTLGCGVSYVIEYNNKDENDIENDIENVKILLQKQSIKYKGPLLQYSSTTSGTELGEIESGSYTMYLQNIKLLCSLTISNDSNNVINDKETVNFGCGKSKPLTKPYTIRE